MKQEDRTHWYQIMKRVKLNDEYDGPDGDLICKLVVMHGGYLNGILIRRTFYRLNKTQRAWINSILPQVPFTLFRKKYHAILNVIMVPNQTFMSCRKEPFQIAHWNLKDWKDTEFVINVPGHVVLSVAANQKDQHVSTKVVLAYFNVSASIENDAVSVYITRKQG